MMKIARIGIAAALSLSAVSGAFAAASATMPAKPAATMAKPMGDAGTNKHMTFSDLQAMNEPDQAKAIKGMSKKNRMAMMKSCPGDAGMNKTLMAFCHTTK